MNGDSAMSPREALNLTVDARDESMTEEKKQPATNGFYGLRDPYSTSYLSSASSQGLALDLSSKRWSSGSVEMSEQQNTPMAGKAPFPLTSGTGPQSESKGALPNDSRDDGVLMYNLDTRNVQLVSRSPNANSNGRKWNSETGEEHAMYSTINLQDQRDCYIGSAETYLGGREQVGKLSVEQQVEMNGNQLRSDQTEAEDPSVEFNSADDMQLPSELLEYGQPNNDDHIYTGNCSGKSWTQNVATASDYYPEQRAYFVYGQRPTADMRYADYANPTNDEAGSAGGYDPNCLYHSGHDFSLKGPDTGPHYPGFDATDESYANGYSEEQYPGDPRRGYGAQERYADVVNVDMDEQYADESSVNMPTEEHYVDGVKMETTRSVEHDPTYDSQRVYYSYDSSKMDTCRATISSAAEGQFAARGQFDGGVQVDGQDVSFSNRKSSQESGEPFSDEDKVYATLNSYTWDGTNIDLNTYEEDCQQSDASYKTTAAYPMVSNGHLNGVQTLDTDANNYPAVRDCSAKRKNGGSRSAGFQEGNNQTDMETSVNIGVLDKKRRARSAMIDTIEDKKSY